MELKYSLDELLQYDAWFAQEDIHWIHTGLGFGACVGNELIKRVLALRESKEFDYIANHAVDTPEIAGALGMDQTSESRQYGRTYIVGIQEYGRYAHHHAMGSWIDEEVNSLLAHRRKSKILWKIKCVLRTPALINRIEATAISKIYLFIAYDFLDMGFIYFLKRLINKVLRRK